MAKDFKDIFGDMDFIHGEWHSLCKYLQKWYYTLSNGIKKDLTKSKRKYRDIDFTKIRGYEAIRRFEKYAEKHTNIKIISCDDNWFTSSDIILIPHPSMGITLWCLPQCAEEQGIMFLHISEIDELIKKLKSMKEFVIKDK